MVARHWRAALPLSSHRPPRRAVLTISYSSDIRMPKLSPVSTSSLPPNLKNHLPINRGAGTRAARRVAHARQSFPNPAC